MTVSDIRKMIDTKVIEHRHLTWELSLLEDKCLSTETLVSDLTESRNIISEASRLTQQQFKEFVESLVTMAIQSVFPEKDYRFVVDFNLQSNRSVIDLLVQQGDKEPYVPEDEQGGAILDIISFALRIVLWSLEKPRSRNVLIFDEPFKWTGDLTERAANMMKEISERLNIQMIMVTHDHRLSDIADRSWMVSRNSEGCSEVVFISGLKIEEEIKVESKIKKRRVI